MVGKERCGQFVSSWIRPCRDLRSKVDLNGHTEDDGLINTRLPAVRPWPPRGVVKEADINPNGVERTVPFPPPEPLDFSSLTPFPDLFGDSVLEQLAVHVGWIDINTYWIIGTAPRARRVNLLGLDLPWQNPNHTVPHLEGSLTGGGIWRNEAKMSAQPTSTFLKSFSFSFNSFDASFCLSTWISSPLALLFSMTGWLQELYW